MRAIMTQLRKHPDVVPVFVITCLGALFATAATVRACMKYPDVSIRRKTNPHPWLNVKPDEQTKFFHMRDYSKVKVLRPSIKEE